jgi:hypothetical protein
MQGTIRLLQFEYKYHKCTGSDIPKLQKINALIDRNQSRCSLGWPVQDLRTPFPTSNARIRSLDRERTQPSLDGAASPRSRGTLRIKQSLQTAQKSAERGVGLLDLEALILYPAAGI